MTYQIKLIFPNATVANSFVNNQALLQLLDFKVRIPQSLIYKHGLLFPVVMDMSDEDI